MVDETSNWCRNTHSIHGKLNYNHQLFGVISETHYIQIQISPTKNTVFFSLNFFASCTERKLPNLFYITSCYPKEGTKNKTKKKEQQNVPQEFMHSLKVT